MVKPESKKPGTTKPIVSNINTKTEETTEEKVEETKPIIKEPTKPKDEITEEKVEETLGVTKNKPQIPILIPIIATLSIGIGGILLGIYFTRRKKALICIQEEETELIARIKVNMKEKILDISQVYQEDKTMVVILTKDLQEKLEQKEITFKWGPNQSKKYKITKEKERYEIPKRET